LEDAAELCDDTLSHDVVTELSSSLDVTRRELAACSDCCDEAENQLAKLSGLPASERTSKTCMHSLNVFIIIGAFTLIDC